MTFGGGGSPPIWGESVRRSLSGQADEMAHGRDASASRAQLDGEEEAELAAQQEARLVGSHLILPRPQRRRGLLDRLFRR
jgi:hypothetical protein